MGLSFFTAVVLFSLLGWLYYSNPEVNPMLLILLGLSASVNLYRGFKELKKKS